MESGFGAWTSLRLFLGILAMAALLSLVWMRAQWWYRGRRFKRQVILELRTLIPRPQIILHDGCWNQHLNKTILHKAVIQNESSHRDLLLGLDGRFVHDLAQLWRAFDVGDNEQWLSQLANLASHRYLWGYEDSLSIVHKRWEELINAYRGLSRFTYRYPMNVAGKFYVDDRCNQCGLCQEWTDNMQRDERTGLFYVAHQPKWWPDVHMMKAFVDEFCPTGAIGDDGDKYDWNRAPIYDWNRAFADKNIRFKLGAPIHGEEPSPAV